MSTSDPQRGVSDGGFYVSNDTWNTANFSYSQTLYLCDYRNWYTVTKAPAGSTAVKAYPNVHKDFDSRPRISDFSTITSSFAERAPGVGIYNYAYDIWLNGVADGNSTELMIWNDNRKQAPSGSQQGSFQSNGRTYTVWRTGSYIAFVDTANTTSGTVDLLAFFRYVISKGWIPATSTIGQIDYGVEIVHTDNQAATFAVTDFSLTAR